MFKTFALAAVASLVAANTNKDDTTGIFPEGEQWRTGTVEVDDHKDDIFYWFFESRSAPETDPLILWLTGGPGCASEVALFFENGPYHFDDDNQTMNLNSNSWNEIGNLLYVDQPIGTGYSQGSIHDVRSESEVAHDMAIFLKGFVEQNPEFEGRDFYITGESYAGHYVPAIAWDILFQETVPLNLKGIAIGNGLTDPYEQYPAYPTFCYENGLISEEWDKVMVGGMKACQGLIKESQSHESRVLDLAAMEFCTILADTCIGNPLNPNFNVYDIRIPCEQPPLCYDFSAADTLLNRSDVQEVLGVPGRKWKDCNQLVHTFLLGDWMTNLMPQIAQILDETEVEVLVYSGDKDWICNWRGGEAWTLATTWSGQAEFGATDYVDWNVNGTAAGQMRQHGNLHFLRVYDAGHMVPMDQPENALEMVRRLVANDWALEEESQPKLIQ